MGINVKDAAESLNVSKSYVSMLESGDSKPNWELLARIADLYGTSADYLLGRTKDPFANQDLSTDEQTTLAAIRALHGRDKLVAHGLLTVLAKEKPEERRFTLDVIARLLLPVQPHIIGEDPGDDIDMATDDESA